MKNGVAIIHWYGRFNLSEKFFQTYFEKIQFYCNYYWIDTIIASGWYTDATIRESEAASLKRVREENWCKQMHWYLEEDSLTTIENITNSAKILDELPIKCDQLIIFASNIHLPKIIYYSLQKYCKKTKKESLLIMQNAILWWQKLFWVWDSCFNDMNLIGYGFDLWFEKQDHIKALRSTLLETHYDEYPELHEDFIDYRKKLRNLL
jgi:DUF218 domain